MPMSRFGVCIVLMLCAGAAVQAEEETSADAELAQTKKDFAAADALSEAGKYAEATQLLQRALVSCEKKFGRKHPDVAVALSQLASLAFKQGDQARAEQLVREAIEIQESTLKPNDPELATSLNLLAILYQARGEPTSAAPLFHRAIRILEAAQGKNHPDVAAVLLGLALVSVDLGDYAQAESLELRALQIDEAALGENDPQLIISLNNLGRLYLTLAHYDKAEAFFQRALRLAETTRGKNHPEVALVLNNLATVYSDEEAYPRAEALFRRVLQIRQATLGSDHPAVAKTLNNLGVLHQRQGAYERAEPLLERALQIWERKLGKNHLEVSVALNNLARSYELTGDGERAVPLYQRALRIIEQVRGKSHPDFGITLNNLATLYVKKGDYTRAEAQYRTLLRIWETALGPNHPNVAIALNNLAEFYRDQGDYERAQPLYEQSLRIREATLDKSHPLITRVLYHMALLRMAQGKTDEALPLVERSATLFENTLRRLFTEARMTSYLNKYGEMQDVIYSLTMSASGTANHRAQRLGLSVALARKGRAVGAAAETAHAILRSLTRPEDQERYHRLQVVRSRLATFYLQKPGATEEPRAVIDALANEADALEVTLAESSAPLRELRALPKLDEIVGAVAGKLPEGSALVEMIAYRPHDFNAIGKQPRSGKRRYLALVLLPGERIETIDLGAAAVIDVAAGALLRDLRTPEQMPEPTAKRLYDLVMAPIRARLPECRHWFLSLDGPLQLVPFAALHDGQRFLLEDHRFNYLTSGRDLLRLHRPAAAPAAPVALFGDPAFTGWPQDEGAVTSAKRGVPGVRQQDLATALRGIAPLPWTRQETTAIAARFPDARLFLGDAATEEALLNLQSPRILHVATHGIFLDDAGAIKPHADRDGSRGRVFDESTPAGPARDPMARSALVMAGATQLAHKPIERPDGQQRDGLVTALEVTGMNLWGTRLVVLSACDSGRGEASSVGQGVYGLRRAFFIAGAETLVISLWSVSDADTHQLMLAYYQRLVAGEGRVEAMRQAALTIRKTHPHPYYWAPFIVLGRPDPL